MYPTTTETKAAQTKAIRDAKRIKALLGKLIDSNPFGLNGQSLMEAESRVHDAILAWEYDNRP